MIEGHETSALRIERLIVGNTGVVAVGERMTEVARKTGLSRESLYKALSAEGSPEFETILTVMSALDLEITPSAG
jgi:probable addiction module antidote protein